VKLIVRQNEANFVHARKSLSKGRLTEEGRMFDRRTHAEVPEETMRQNFSVCFFAKDFYV
jgi:hypothetical protein